jgi:hypothetical protein
MIPGMPVEHACCSKRQDGAPRAAAAPDGSGGMIIPGHHDLEIRRKFRSLRMGISWQHLANLHQSSELVCLDPGGHQCAGTRCRRGSSKTRVSLRIHRH